MSLKTLFKRTNGSTEFEVTPEIANEETLNEIRKILASGTIGHDITGIGHGVKVVTVAGTHEVLSLSVVCKLVIIQAQTDNTDKVAVGAVKVDATVATGTGIILDPGDTITIPCKDLSDIFIDSLASGEGVRYTYFF